MPLTRHLSAALLLYTGLVCVGQAQGWPPLDGEVSGNFQWRAQPGVPPVSWRVKLVPPVVPDTARLAATLTAPGLAVEAEAMLTGTWRVVSGTVQLAEWSRPALAAAGSGLPPDLAVDGILRLGGEGTWQGTAINGRLTLTLADGAVRSEAQDWEVKDLSFEAVVAVQSGAVVLHAMRLTADTIEAAGVTARNLLVEATGGVDGRIEVRRAEVAVFGGRVMLSPFTVNPAQPEVNATAELSGLALAELAKLIPTALTAAEGRLEGSIGVQWSPASGFQPKSGALSVSADTTATLRLAATPGFLTQHLPERIQLLPAWLRLPANWFAPINPAYDTLERIEMGRQELTVEKMRVALYPDGPDGPRSAVVEVTARPATGGVVELVSFTVNVAGPLQQVLQLGLDDRARMNFKTGK